MFARLNILNSDDLFKWQRSTFSLRNFMALALTKNSHRGYSMPSAMADISMTYGWDISSEITRCDTHAHTHTDSKNEWQKVDKTFLQSSCQEKVADVSTVCGCECWEWCSSTRRAQRAGAAPTKWYSLWNSMLSSSIIFMQLLTARFRQRLPFKEAGVFYISRRGISQRHWECTLIWDTVPGLLACKAVFGGRKKRPWTSSRKLLRVV